VGPKCPDISNMYFLTMFNNSVVKHFIIADLYSISSGQEGILSYPCPLAGGGFCPRGFCTVPET